MAEQGMSDSVSTDSEQQWELLLEQAIADLAHGVSTDLRHEASIIERQ